MNKRVVLVARDAAPSGCFKRLAPILNERDCEVNLIIGGGKPLTQSTVEIQLAVASADVVVLGMSSSPDLAQPEIAAGQAAKNAGKPCGFYGDVPHCWGRARPDTWFAELAANTAFYFGVTQADADLAREVFPRAKLIGTGNPLREEMAFPRFTRQEVRAKLGIEPEENFVLAPGGKFAAGNLALWTVIMEALSLLAKGGGLFQLVLATHPGDRTPFAIDGTTQKPLGLYEELVAFSPVPARIVDKDVLTTSDMVPGADIIVEFGSSIGIEGAFQNVPVISLGFEPLFRRFEKISGSRIIEAVSDGLSDLVVADASELAGKISVLLTPDGFAPMRERQRQLCPKPAECGAALRRIADEIASM